MAGPFKEPRTEAEKAYNMFRTLQAFEQQLRTENNHRDADLVEQLQYAHTTSLAGLWDILSNHNKPA